MISKPASRSYLIDQILPAFEVHLFAGPSGSGKTRLLFQMTRDWEGGLPVFGYDARPTSFSYYSLDRSMPSIQETMHHICPGIGMTIETLTRPPKAVPVRQQIESLFAKHPNSEVFILDGMARLVPGGKTNDYDIVADFLTDLMDCCQRNKRTILGVLHSPKMRENEKYLAPRQRIAGSVAWAAYCETIFILDPVHPENPEDRTREFSILPRNFPEKRLLLQFSSDGTLVPLGDDPVKNTLGLLAELPPNVDLTRDEVLQIAQSLGLSRAAVDRSLKQLLETGDLSKPQWGRYRKSC